MKSFKGGVHPPYEKRTKDAPIKEIEPPAQLVVPLSQHTGAPANPLVKRGDQVAEGQLIGEAQGFISANVHAPLPGKVKAVAERHTPLGTRSLSVVIEVDPEGPRWEAQEDPNWEDASPDAIRERVKEAGIVGLGGAAFPTHVKLSPPKDYPVDTVIINGAECEPYLTADDRIMRERAEDVVRGAHLVRQAVGAKRVLIGIEDNKPEAIEAMERAAKAYGFEVVPLHTKYPQGSEKQLIQVLTGRQVPSGGLPFHVGVVVQNVGTAVAIYEAVRFRKPLIERVVTLSGLGAKGPGNYLVRIGTLFSHLVQATGGADEERVVKVLNGGPMMGIAQWTLDVPVIKGTSGVLLLTAEETSLEEEGPCIRCGSCVEVCPINLLPFLIARLAEKRLFDRAERYHILDCIECGSCAYVCPARRHLVHHIRYGKREILAMKKKEAAKK